MKIGTIATGVGVSTTINLTYLPQYLFWANATALQSLKVSVLGKGVICDLDSDGIAALSGIRRYGNVTNGLLIPLADGLIPNKNVEIVAVNGVAANIDLYGFALQKGAAYVKSLQQTVLANSGQVFDKFAFLGFDSTLSDSDLINVTYLDGHSQKWVGTELKQAVTLFQNETDAFAIDNMEFEIDEVSFIPVANRKVYLITFDNEL